MFARGGGEGGCAPFCCVELVGLERARCREWKHTVLEAGGGTLLYQIPIVFKYVGKSE